MQERTPFPTFPPIPAEASMSGEDDLPQLDRRLVCALSIRLDGRPVYSCVSYSIPQGFVRVLFGNGPGIMVQGEGDNAALVTVKVAGRVQVERKSLPSVDPREGEPKCQG